ncbi:MAG: hypothetical protein JNL98_17720 [Bryobacterales bacterium]|nr:hypothetical protein [Bryobacterales bacterium]
MNRVYRDRVLCVAGLIGNGYRVRPGDTLPHGWAGGGRRLYFRVSISLLNDAYRFLRNLEADDDDEDAEDAEDAAALTA